MVTDGGGGDYIYSIDADKMATILRQGVIITDGLSGVIHQAKDTFAHIILGNKLQSNPILIIQALSIIASLGNILFSPHRPGL